MLGAVCWRCANSALFLAFGRKVGLTRFHCGVFVLWCLDSVVGGSCYPLFLASIKQHALCVTPWPELNQSKTVTRVRPDTATQDANASTMLNMGTWTSKVPQFMDHPQFWAKGLFWALWRSRHNTSVLQELGLMTWYCTSGS